VVLARVDLRNHPLGTNPLPLCDLTRFHARFWECALLG
jgi:hypothetical protein